MATLDERCILGESGDILIEEDVYQSNFINVASEKDEGYRRLINLPVAKDVAFIRETLLIVTSDGELMLVHNNHPEGVIINAGLLTPPQAGGSVRRFKKVYNSRPFMLLDENKTLHFVNLIKAVRETIPDFDLKLFKHPITNFNMDKTYAVSKIDNVEWILGNSANYDDGIIEIIIIKVPGGIINSFPLAISLNNYKVTDGRFGRMGNCFTYRENGVKYADSGKEKIEIGEDVIDIIYSGSAFYILNSLNELRTTGFYIMNERIPSQRTIDYFTPTRLLNSTERNLAYVEDSGGNIYNALQIVDEEEVHPVESINLPVILQGFGRRGVMTKSAQSGKSRK